MFRGCSEEQNSVFWNRIAKRREAAFIKAILNTLWDFVLYGVMVPAAPRLRCGFGSVVRVNIIPGSVGFIVHLSLSAPNSEHHFPIKTRILVLILVMGRIHNYGTVLQPQWRDLVESSQVSCLYGTFSRTKNMTAMFLCRGCQCSW